MSGVFSEENINEKVGSYFCQVQICKIWSQYFILSEDL